MNYQLSTSLAKFIEPFRKPEINLLVLIDKNCKECFDINIIYNSIKSSNNYVIKSEKVEDYKNYLNLIKSLKIDKIPSIIISGEVEKVANIFSRIPGYRKVEDKIVIESYPPFLSLSDNKIYGIVDIIYLVPRNCTKCYDVTLHKRILEEGYLVKIGKEKTVYTDEEEGKELIKKYNITAVPTIILSKDISYYYLLASIWDQVGSIEEDGSYVFRNENWMQEYGGYVKVWNSIIHYSWL